jgi:hypothetical protein
MVGASFTIIPRRPRRRSLLSVAAVYDRRWVSLSNTANQEFLPETANPANSLPSRGAPDSRAHNALLLI